MLRKTHMVSLTSRSLVVRTNIVQTRQTVKTIQDDPGLLMIDLEPLLMRALSEEHRREDDGSGDLEEGQELEYINDSVQSNIPGITDLSANSNHLNICKIFTESLSFVSSNVPPARATRPANTPLTRAQRRLRVAREKAIAAAGTPEQIPYRKVRSSVSKKFATVQTYKTAFNAKALLVARGAYIGLRCKNGKSYSTLQDALDAGCKLVEWDGK